MLVIYFAGSRFVEHFNAAIIAFFDSESAVVTTQVYVTRILTVRQPYGRQQADEDKQYRFHCNVRGSTRR